MGIFDKNGKESRIASGITTIANGTIIEGVINIECNLQIDGEFKGDIFSKASITIGENGVIEGKIVANHLICSGHVKGKIMVNGLDILSKGKVYGEIKYSTLRIDQGGTLEGTTARIDDIGKLGLNEEKKVIHFEAKDILDEVVDEIEESEDNNSDEKNKNKSKNKK